MSDSTRIEELRKEIEKLCGNCDRPGKEELGNIILSSMAFGFIEGLNAPSADRPQGEWIPCSERMPEESGSYLTWSAIGFIPDHVDEPNTYEGIAIASFNKDLCDWFGTEKVYAWMPLPKPWEGAE